MLPISSDLVNNDEGQTEYICHVHFPVSFSRCASFWLDFVVIKIDALLEFLLAQGIMPEPEPPLTIPAKRELPVRRIASAPTTPRMSGGPVTPSPSPSPGSKKSGSKLGHAVCFCWITAHTLAD